MERNEIPYIAFEAEMARREIQRLADKMESM